MCQSTAQSGERPGMNGTGGAGGAQLGVSSE